jgi:hypothetical protein
VSQYTANLPMPVAPLVDPATGIISSVWLSWMTALFKRTGGGVGAGPAFPDDAIPQPDGIGAPGIVTKLSRGDHVHPSGSGPLVPITVGASPFTYTAPSHGAVLVNGPGVIRLQLSFDGATFYPTGSWYGAFPLAKGALARLTFIGSPSMVFIPT